MVKRYVSIFYLREVVGRDNEKQLQLSMGKYLNFLT